MRYAILIIGAAGLLAFLTRTDLGGGFALGSKTPTVVSHYASGAKRSEVRYRDGIRHGPAQAWYSDGSKRYEGTFEDGEEAGLWTFWTEDGLVDESRTGVYQAGDLLTTEG